MSETLKNFVDPAALDLGLDNLLRKVFPDLPYDPSFVRNHGMLDAINGENLGAAGSYHIDLGNLGRNRPVLTNSNTWTRDNWNTAPSQHDFMQKIIEKQSIFNENADFSKLAKQVFQKK